MYIYTYVLIQIYTCICICIYFFIYTYLHIYMCILTYLYIYITYRWILLRMSLRRTEWNCSNCLVQKKFEAIRLRAQRTLQAALFKLFNTKTLSSTIRPALACVPCLHRSRHVENNFPNSAAMHCTYSTYIYISMFCVCMSGRPSPGIPARRLDPAHM